LGERRYEVVLAQSVFQSLRRVADKKLLREISAAIDGLALAPEAQGKPLESPLGGLWSVRAARQRWRVVFEIDADRRRVAVLLVGRRRPGHLEDVYAVAARLLRGLTE
jgi:mRNA interferase RelE/StbE